MSFCKAIVENPDVIREVLRLYRETEMPMKDIAAHMNFRDANVWAIVNQNLSEEERKRLKAIRYRNNKLGVQNPQFGKKPRNFVGECEDGRGYLTEVVDGVRYFVHRVIIARMLCLHPSQLPEELVVHHIDGNKQNNHPDNLALVTRVGHRSLHSLTDWKSALSR
jgi:hypothetical protein